MNDEQRAALVQAIEAELDSYCPSPFNGAFAVSLMQIIDRLLADRAVPEPDANAIERVAIAIHEQDPKMRYRINEPHRPYLWDELHPDFQDDLRDKARAALAVAPTVQAVAGNDLDAMLDSVHRDAEVHVWLESEPEPEVGLSHYFMARLDVNGPNTSKPHYGTGPTRMDAIISAVERAKEAAQ